MAPDLGHIFASVLHKDDLDLYLDLIFLLFSPTYLKHIAPKGESTKHYIYKRQRSYAAE